MLKFFVRTLFWQLFFSYMYVEKAAEMTFVQKILRKMLMKLTTGQPLLVSQNEEMMTVK